MYGIALSVAACLQGGTRVDVAWNLDPDRTPAFDPTDAIAITPGGGRLGQLLDGALDSRLIEVAAAKLSEGRIVTVELNPVEASLVGASTGTELRVAVAPAEVLPEQLWEHALARQAVELVATRDDDRLLTYTLGEAPSHVAMAVSDDELVCRWVPTPMLVVLGGGPIVEALGHQARLVGWNVEAGVGTETAVGLAPTLSPIDGIVVAGHDTESVGRVLQAALGSSVGYIGSIGPSSLQQDRGDWLAYRGVTDTTRIHGPAGLPIGASTPEEIAVAVIAEMIGARSAAV